MITPEQMARWIFERTKQIMDAAEERKKNPKPTVEDRLAALEANVADLKTKVK